MIYKEAEEIRLGNMIHVRSKLIASIRGNERILESLKKALDGIDAELKELDWINPDD